MTRAAEPQVAALLSLLQPMDEGNERQLLIGKTGTSA
jgi:hypothetical protein